MREMKEREEKQIIGLRDKIIEWEDKKFKACLLKIRNKDSIKRVFCAKLYKER